MKDSLSSLRLRQQDQLIDAPFACLWPAYTMGIVTDHHEVSLEAL
jgi:hypothetical protein